LLGTQKRFEEAFYWLGPVAKKGLKLYEELKNRDNEKPEKKKRTDNNQPDPDRMVLIKGGTFMMGSPADEPEHWDNEDPQHKVTLSSFYMGKFQVMQAEYELVMGVNLSYNIGPSLPVENVSWYDAIEYCNRLSLLEGLPPAYTINGTNVTWDRNTNGYRLPTEAEWEYACRAGTTTPYHTGNTITKRQANFDGNEIEPVGSYAPNAWGLHDMHGNVWEWCWDWHGSYSRGVKIDPIGASSGSRRVARGGSWRSIAENVRSAYRADYTPSYMNDCNGFRLVHN
jgi:formylglycine-generating enzyme required for sulfatase activity